MEDSDLSPRQRKRAQADRAARAAQMERSAPLSNDVPMASLDRYGLHCGQAVLRLVSTPGGWLRLVPDRSGKVWCKWRYTEGQWAEHYSLAVHDPSKCNLAEALEALERKVHGAHADPPTHKPTPDRY